jgi:peptide/nickel transport system permease protein
VTIRLRTLARIPGAVVGALVLAGIVGVALAASQLTGLDPLEIAGPPFLWPGEDSAFVLGTDIMGRDILAGIVHGARISLEIGLAAGLAAAALGLIVGAVAGYFGNWVDQVLMRFAELFQIMPPLLFTIVLVVVVGPTIGVIIAGIVVTSWPQVARLVRAEAMRLRRSEFIQAAVVIGMNDRAILLKHVAPNVLSPAVVMISILAGNAILTESALSFLGMGDPNVMTWGNMIGSGREALRSAWYMTAIPGLAVLLTVTALNLLSNGVNDLLNPRRRAWL